MSRSPRSFLATAALYAISSAAFAVCEPLLEVPGATQPRLALNACEVRLASGTSADGTLLILELRDDAARRWSEALANQKDGLGAELLAGQAVLRAPLFGSGLPDGVLLWSSSARLVPEPSWRWHEAGRLALKAPLPQAAAASSCTLPTRGALVFWIGVRDVAPGQVIVPRVMVTPNPHTFEPVPPNCVAGWELSEAAPAVLPDARVGALMVRPDAASGSVFTLRTRVGAQLVEGRLRVVRPSAGALVGSWRQLSEATCARHMLRKPATPIGELRFDAGGTFSLAWDAGAVNAP